MEDIYESQAIFENRHNGSGISSVEFMQRGLNSL